MTARHGSCILSSAHAKVYLVYDFVYLLEKPCIQSYAKRESTILLATPADEDQMIVMRTSRTSGEMEMMN